MITNFISARQGIETRAKIVEFVEQFQRIHGYGPYITYIAKGIGVSPQTVWKHTEKLKQLGVVERKYGSYSEVKLK